MQKYMTFEEAVKEASSKDAKIARKAWFTPGNPKWLAWMPPYIIPEATVNGRTKKFLPSGDLRVAGYLACYDASKDMSWSCGFQLTFDDTTADDWYVFVDA